MNKKNHIGIVFFILAVLTSCTNPKNDTSQSVVSPDESLKVNTFQTERGIGYQLIYKGKVLIDSSFQSFDFLNQPSLGKNLSLINTERKSLNETWETVWGEQHFVKNNHNELRLSFKEKTEEEREVDVIFRVFNDGIGFRYVFPEQEKWKQLVFRQFNQ